MSESNYYEKMSNGSIMYPELAICIEEIDRQFPKKTYKFIIPALTPDMGSSLNEVNKEIRQQNTAIVNQDNNIEIENVKMTNYIEIPLPRELLSYLGMDFDYTGTTNINGSGKLSHTAEEYLKGTASISGDSHLDANGSVIEGGSINVSGNGSTSGDFSANVTSSGSITFSGNGNFNINGKIRNNAIDRYIEKNSEWIVMFIGGDINKPRIIAPYNHLPSKK